MYHGHYLGEELSLEVYCTLFVIAFILVLRINSKQCSWTDRWDLDEGFATFKF